MRSLLRTLAVLLAVAPLPAQQGQPLQQPLPDVPALRTRVNLVVVDVVVTDKNQQPVVGLKASDFTLLENNTSQELKVFEEHTPTVAAGPPPPPLAPGTFTNYTQFRGNGPLNILLMDAIDTEPIDQSRVRQQVLRFLDESRPGTQFAFFALDMGGLKILQGFTENKDLLRAAVNNFKPMLNVFQQSPIDHMGGAGLKEAGDGGTVLNRAGKGMTQALASMKPKYTLDGVNMLSRYLAGIAGHKNVLWFAGHFDFNAAPTASSDNPFANSPMQAEEFRDTVDLFSSKQVTIYPINAQGLTLDSQMEDNLNATDLAVQTGGRAVLNSNDISGIIKRDVEMGATYYTLAYTPTDLNYDGKYRTVKVKVKAPGTVLSYRRGYYADDPNKPVHAPAARGQQGTPSTTEGFSPMHMALARGTPEPTQVVMFARVLPHGKPEPMAAEGNKMRGNVKGPYQRYSIDATFDPRGMAFEPLPNGTWNDTVEVISFLYDGDNRLVNEMAQDAVMNLKESPETFAAKGGAPVHQEISVPVKGTYFLRIAVHDKRGDRVGAVEVPISAVSKLR